MIPKLYDQYFIQKQDERRNLFSLVADKYNVKTGIYPGSFVHITPAFYIPEMVFIDSDKRMKKFFQDENTYTYIEANKTYDGPSKISWAQTDYSLINDIPTNYFDIMFSFYAGFISQACKEYVKHGAIVIANNSHGDASLAIADPDYEPIGVVIRNGDKFRIKTDNIREYLIKKDNSEIDSNKVQKRMTGERFAKSAYAYVFTKIH